MVKLFPTRISHHVIACFPKQPIMAPAAPNTVRPWPTAHQISTLAPRNDVVAAPSRDDIPTRGAHNLVITVSSNNGGPLAVTGDWRR
jgi:hypothetical protein